MILVQMRSRVRLKLERMQQGLDGEEESQVESDGTGTTSQSAVEKMNADEEGLNEIADDNNNKMIAKNPAYKDEDEPPALVGIVTPVFSRQPSSAFKYYGDDIMDRFYMKSCKVCNFMTKHQKDLDTHIQGKKCKKAHVAQPPVASLQVKRSSSLMKTIVIKNFLNVNEAPGQAVRKVSEKEHTCKLVKDSSNGGSYGFRLICAGNIAVF